MVDYPKTVTEFHQRFGAEVACRNYLEQIRWPEGPQCPRCTRAKAWKMKPPFYRCTRCGYDFTVTAGTLFDNTNLPLRLWFEAMWAVVNQKNGMSALGVQRILGLGSYRTAWRWLHKLRRAMVRPGRDRLAGTVEVDETYVGGEHSGKRGRGAEGKVLVLIAAQAEGSKIGRIRLARIPNASGLALLPEVGRGVEPGSQVLTDGWGGYGGLAAQGYKHDIVRATSIVGENLLPRCHRVASLLIQFGYQLWRYLFTNRRKRIRICF